MSIRRKWYITLMQADSSKQVNLTISNNIGNFLLIVLLLCISTLGCGAFYIWKKNSDLVQLSKLQKENAVLRERLEYFSDQMDSLLIKVQIMENWEENLRQERRLRPVNSDVRALGSGGEPYQDPSFLPFCDDLHEIYNENLQKLYHVIAKVSLTYETHLDLVSSLQSRESLYRTTPTIWPTFGRITSEFGSRSHPVFAHRQLHAGIDIANDRGTPVYATAEGIVSFAGRSGQSGNLIRVDHVSGYQTRYAHLDRILVRPGESVYKGQIIAQIGNTGVATGFHLHYEVLEVGKGVANPAYFMNITEDQIQVLSRK